ncbi:unnamed protein product [Fusarium equiseti]|uniref:Arrestin-like N-terminal domain-containing protein n=1 Tax=Fusarium equiseti TaxID=61235 RepID=A0A8J2IQS0_FUSEQ|nr:unnamed protein product [Fusarium equiseti]
MLQPFGSSEKSYSCFALVRTCQDNPGILRRGPLRIKKGKDRSWSFSFIVPVFADPRENEQTSSPSYTPVGAAGHQLPPSYTLHKYGIVTACVEYQVCAKLIYLDAEERTQVAHAIHPFKLIHYSPYPPITYSAVKRWRHPKSIRSPRLLPGAKFLLAKRSLSRNSNPEFKFDLLFELPSTIQLDNPAPIPLRLSIDPKWEESDKRLGGEGEREFTTELNLDLSRAIHRLRGEINIPCASSWGPVDVGELINFRLGLIHETGFPKPSMNMEITPSFRTYNMTVTHRLAWKIQVKIAGEAFIVGGKADVLILRSSDGRIPRGWEGNPYLPAGTETETETEVAEADSRSPSLWDQEDDSWIAPPPEDEAPPSFTDACSLRLLVSLGIVSEFVRVFADTGPSKPSKNPDSRANSRSDKTHGGVQRPDEVKFYEPGMERDMPETSTLQAYLAHRHVPVSDDEVKYFESLVDRKVSQISPTKHHTDELLADVACAIYRLTFQSSS